MIRNLPAVAALPLAQADIKRATRLQAATDALLEAMRVGLEPPEPYAFGRTLATARAQLDHRTFNVAWAEGQVLTLEQTVALALERAT